MRRRKPTFASLFSGCGGFDLGFTQAEYKCVGAFDIDPDAIRVYRANLSGRAIICDLSTFGTVKVEATPDVVLAGPPCQGFSTAGKRKLNDPRNSLLIKAAEISIALRPRVIVVENVAGVVAGSHRKFWDEMLAVLRSGGYTTTQLRCDATKLGVPQLRKRLMAVAWNTSFEGQIALPTCAGGTLRDAIGHINGAPNHDCRNIKPSSHAAIIASHIGPNEKLCNVRASSRAVHTWDIPDVFGRTNKRERATLEALLQRRRQKRLRDFGDADPVTAQALRSFVGRPVAQTLRALIAKGYVRRVGRSYDLVHTFNGKFRRLEWDKPSPTVDTKFGDPYYFLHPEEDRAFTIREAARVQGFPDSFVFSGSKASQYRMIGNAVPPPLAKSLADFLRDHVLV